VDVENLQRVFEDSGFHRVIVFSENHTKPTKQNLENTFANLPQQSRLWVHIGTHGCRLQDSVVLAACNSQRDVGISSFISADEVDHWISRHNFTIVRITIDTSISRQQHFPPIS